MKFWLWQIDVDVEKLLKNRHPDYPEHKEIESKKYILAVKAKSEINSLKILSSKLKKDNGKDFTDFIKSWSLIAYYANEKDFDKAAIIKLHI